MNRWGTALLAAAIAAATLTACNSTPTSGALVGDSIVLKCDPQVRSSHPHDQWATRDYGGTGFYSTPGFYDGFLWPQDDVYVSIGVNDAIRWDQPGDYVTPIDPNDYYNHVTELLSRTTGQVWWSNIHIESIRAGEDVRRERARVINNVLQLAGALNPRMHYIDFNAQADPSWFDPSDPLHPTSPDGCQHWANMHP